MTDGLATGTPTFFEPDGPVDPLAAVIFCVEHGAPALLLDSHAFPAAFFDLSTGVAGEVVQKLTDYRIRMAAVVPDLPVQPLRFREFAREANAGSQFHFFASRQEAVDWLESDGASAGYPGKSGRFRPPRCWPPRFAGMAFLIAA